MRCALRRGEAQILRAFELAFGRLLLDLRVLGERFRPDIGGEQFRIALLKPKIRRPLVTKKRLAVADQELVDAHHRGFGGSIVVLHLGPRHDFVKPVRFEKRHNPFEAPLQRPHHAIFIARRQPRLPRIHPAPVPVCEHVDTSSLTIRRA